MDGFETGRPSVSGGGGVMNSGMWEQYREFAGGNLVGSGGKSGGYSARLGGWTSGYADRWGFLRRNLGDDYKEHYGRVEVYHDTIGSQTTIVRLRDDNLDDVASIRYVINANPDLVDLRLFIGSSNVASLAQAYSKQTWVRLEWRLVVDGTNGIFTLLRNGDEVLSYVGDTKGSNLESIRYLDIGPTNRAANRMIIDDVAINDTTGSVNNSWPGPGSILLLKPKGAGNYTQWTPSSGDNFARVATIPYSASHYVESDTVDEIDTYEMQTLADLGVDTSDPAFNIKAVQHLMAGRWDEAETELSRVLRLGAADNTGTAVTLTNTYNRYWDEMFEVNPFDSQPWEVADLNSLEAGIKHIAVSP